MAQVARQNAELSEIRRKADDVVTTQQAEIEQLASIKEREFGSSEVPTQMNPEDLPMRRCSCLSSLRSRSLLTGLSSTR
jgi:hypothetical protein